MFTSLTTAELGMLRSKLYSCGHKAAQVAHCIGSEALQLPALSAEQEIMWARRARFTALMSDAYELAELAETSRAGSAVCRTCGFSDCPGAYGGDCPRWPARGGTEI